MATAPRLEPAAAEEAQRAFDADPADAAAALALARHHHAGDGEREVRRVLSRHLDAAGSLDALHRLMEAQLPDERERAALLAQLAWLQAEALGDPDRGQDLAKEALAIDPASAAAREAHARLSRELHRREETAPRQVPWLLQQVMADTPAVRREELRREQAALAEAPAAPAPGVGFDPWDDGAAPDPSYDQTVKIPALNVRALQAEGASAQGEDTGRHAAPAKADPDGLDGPTSPGAPTPAQLAAELFEPAAAVVKQCQTLLQLPPPVALQALAALQRDAARPADRALVMETTARVHELAGDRERAFEAALESARTVPPGRRLLDELFRLALLTGTYRELAAAYEEVLRAPLDDADRVYLHLKLGHLYGRELSRPLAAARHCRQALAVEPYNLEALRRLGELLGREGRWADVVPVKLRELEAVWRTTGDVEQTVVVKRELARLHEERLGDHEGALVQYREILEVLPGDPSALSALHRLAELGAVSDPVGRQAFGLLEGLYPDLGAWTRLGDLLSVAARDALGAGRTLEAAELHRRAAGIFETRQKDPGRAFIDLVRAIQVLPQGEAAAADRLDPEEVGRTTRQLVDDLLRTGRAAGVHAQMAAVCEDLALRIGGEAGAGVLVRLAETELEDLEDTARAAARLARAVELSGDDPAVESRLEGIYVARGAWRELASFYRARASRLADPQARGEVLFRLAEILEDELASPTEAAAVYQEIIDVQGGNADALAAVCRLLEKAQDWAALAEALERAVSGAAAVEQKKRALLKRAEVFQTHLRDPHGARADWQRVLALDPGCVAALQGMADTAEEEGDARETAVALESSLSGLRPGDPGRADGYRRLARLYGDVLDQPARARVAWEEVLEEAPLDGEAFARLRTGYRRGGALEKLAALLGARLEAEPRHEDARAWRRELVSALEHLGRAEEVGRAWRRALRVDPADTEALSRLAAFHTARQNRAELEQTLRDWISATLERPVKADLWTRLGGVLRQGRPEEARAAFEKALTLCPDHADAREALIELYRGAEEPARLLPLLEAKVRTLVDPHERAAALRELWEVARRLGEAGDAAAGRRSREALQEACLLEPEDDELWAALGHTLSAPDQAAELAGRLEARAARLEGARRAKALLEAAEAHRRSVGPDALTRDRARRCLERARDAAPDDHEVLVEILGMLRSTYAATGAWEALAGVLEALVDPARTPDPRGRGALLEELADVLEHRLGRLDETARWLERAGELPGAAAARFLERRTTLHGRLGDWPQVLALLDERIRLHRGEPLELALRLDAAEVAERRLDDLDAALVHLRAALALEPGDGEILARMERAGLAGRRHGELAAVLLEEAGRTDDPDRRADLLVRAARIEEAHLGDTASARRDAEAALALEGIAPERRRAAQEVLSRVLATTRAFSELAALCEARLAQTQDASERAGLHLAAGRALEQLPDGLERALGAFRAALEADPACTEAMDALAARAEACEDPNTAVEMVLRQVPLTADAEARARLFERAGALHERRGDEAAAVEAYREAAAAAPAATGPRRALLRLLRGRGDDQGVLQAARQLAALAQDPDERAASWIEAGRVLEAEGDPGGARQAYEQALAARPGHFGGSVALSGLLLAERPRQALGLLEAAIVHLDADHDRERLAEARVRAAEAAGASGDPGVAERHLKEAHRLGPKQPATLLRLSDLFAARGDATHALDLLRDLLARDADALPPEDRAAAERRTGLALLAQGRVADAAGHLGAALTLAPRDREALEGLCEAHERAGRYADVIEVLQRLRNLSRDPDERRRRMLAIADLWSERLHDAGRAVRALGEALAEHPDDPDVLLRLAREQERRGAPDEAVDALERLIALRTDDGERARLYTRLGNIRRDRTEATEPALAAYRQALTLAREPTDVDAALSAVRELAARRRNPTPLAEVLGWFADRRPAYPGEAPLRREQAEVLRYQLSDRSGAIAALERVAALDPDDLKAAEDLARLHERQGQDKEAIARWRQVLRAAPFDPDGYRNLLRLFGRTGQALGASVVASLLVLLEEADADEQALARRLDAVGDPAAPLDPEDRRRDLVHPDARGPVADLVAALGVEGAALVVPSVWALRRESAGPFTTTAGPAAQSVADALLLAVRTLAIPAADVHVAAAGDLRILRAAPALRPLVTVSQAVLRGERQLPPAALRFHAGRALMGVLPTYWPARVLSLQSLKNLLEAAAHLAGARCGDRDVEKLARRLERALPAARAEAVSAAARAWVEAPGAVDLRRFAEGVEHTAVRAGMLLAGSPEAAVKALRLEGEVGRTVLREAVRFALSPEHLALRARIWGH